MLSLGTAWFCICKYFKAQRADSLYWLQNKSSYKGWVFWTPLRNPHGIKHFYSHGCTSSVHWFISHSQRVFFPAEINSWPLNSKWCFSTWNVLQENTSFPSLPLQALGWQRVSPPAAHGDLWGSWEVLNGPFFLFSLDQHIPPSLFSTSTALSFISLISVVTEAIFMASQVTGSEKIVIFKAGYEPFLLYLQQCNLISH